MASRNVARERRTKYAQGIHAGLSQREAARAAGYRGSDRNLDIHASKLAKHPEVQAHLAKLRAAGDRRAVLKREEALRILSQQVKGLQGYMQYAERPIGPAPKEGEEDTRVVARVLVGVDLEKLEADGKLHLVEGIKFTHDGRAEIRLATVQGALDRLAKLEGWAQPSKHVVAGDAETLQKMLKGLSDEELEKLEDGTGEPA